MPRSSKKINKKIGPKLFWPKRTGFTHLISFASLFKLRKKKKIIHDFDRQKKNIILLSDANIAIDEEWAPPQLIYRSSFCHIIGRYIILKEIKDQTLHLHWQYCFVQTIFSRRFGTQLLEKLF